MEEYRRKHRMRRVHVRLDENQATGVSMSFHQYYRGEFTEFLNVLIVQYGENLTRCFETLKPLMVVLKPHLTEPSIDDIIDLVRFFPSNLSIDPHILHAEFSNFVSHVNLERKTVFPLTNRCYHLLMTIPVTVAKDERTFNRLKIVKTPLRTTMGDQRLESLLLMSYEKDFTHSIDFECVARDWADLKTRRINCPHS